MTIGNDARIVLAGLADVLIPAADGMPSASQADVAGRWLDQVLAARPDLSKGLTDLISMVRGRDPRDVVADLEAKEASAYGVLTELVAGAYFMNPDVQLRDRLRWPGATPH